MAADTRARRRARRSNNILYRHKRMRTTLARISSCALHDTLTAPPAAAQRRRRAPRAARCSTSGTRAGRTRCRRPARCACLVPGCVRPQASTPRLMHAPATVRSENSDGRWQRWQRPTFLVTVSACGTSERICVHACQSTARNAACGCVRHLSKGLAAKVTVEPGHNHGFVVLVDRGDAELLQVRKELRLRCQQQRSEAAARAALFHWRTSSTAMTSTASNSAFVRRSCSAASSGSARHCCGHARVAPSGARRAGR
jgi:hypothetical protein